MNGSITFDGSLVGDISGGGGGGGDEVIITPVVTSGTKIADVSVNGVEKDLYCPTSPAPTEVEVTPLQQSGTKIATIEVDENEVDLYAPNPTQVNVTPVQQSGTKIATIGVNGVNTDLYAPNNSGEIYSTSERVVGTWIDSKPIYKKTFTVALNIPYNTSQVITISDYITNIDKIIKSESFITLENEDATTVLPYVLSSNDLSGYSTGYALGSGVIYITRGWTQGSWNGIGVLYATLYYTKTTDN